MTVDQLYSFVFRGLLTEAGLDKVGRIKRRHFGSEDASQMRKNLAYDMLDRDFLSGAEFMSVIYTAIHAFENIVRQFVVKTMQEKHGADWWEKAPKKVRDRANNRKTEEAKINWHSPRGEAEINYCDFGDLSSVIITNWESFEDLLPEREWAKTILDVLEKSRNVVMHGGMLDQVDIVRIGVNIRDWIRQTG